MTKIQMKIYSSLIFFLSSSHSTNKYISEKSGSYNAIQSYITYKIGDKRSRSFLLYTFMFMRTIDEQISRAIRPAVHTNCLLVYMQYINDVRTLVHRPVYITHHDSRQSPTEIALFMHIARYYTLGTFSGKITTNLTRCVIIIFHIYQIKNISKVQ